MAFSWSGRRIGYVLVMTVDRCPYMIVDSSMRMIERVIDGVLSSIHRDEQEAFMRLGG